MSCARTSHPSSPPPMPPEDDSTDRPSAREDSPLSFKRQATRVRDLFSIPGPVKRLFDKVPIVTYQPNELPQRTPKPTGLPSLYVFIGDREAALGRPSFNPSCLKWQAFLKIAGIQHRLIPSNNHASPTGVLPFLLPLAKTHEAPLPITSNKLVKFAKENGSKVRTPSSMRYEAYQSLLDNQIWKAWLHNLYLDLQNFSSVAQPLYIQPVSSNPLVRETISRQLQAAAEAELLKCGPLIKVDDLFNEASNAFQALSTLLGDGEWFFGGDEPTLFDASVFAYTHLLLDETMGWKEKRLMTALHLRENLVLHRERLLVQYFDSGVL